ncbi:hypothetical protein HDV06_006363 [Boothiomyces sp. JEL0866]|nr:hypothetical protein HDV06_006363 [Boothiomyces sp. JEL0866]
MGGQNIHEDSNINRILNEADLMNFLLLLAAVFAVAIEKRDPNTVCPFGGIGGHCPGKPMPGTDGGYS